MMATMPTVAAPPDALDNIIKLFSLAGPALGGGKTTGTSSQTTSGTATKTIDPAASKQMDDLLANILRQNQNPAIDDMIANIMERAKQAFAPAIGQSLAGGNRAYSDTTLQSAAREAAARATGEAAGAKLSFIQGNNQTAANLVNNKVANSTSETKTGTTTGTNISQVGVSPAGKLLQYGTGALGAYSLYRKLAGKKGLNTIDDFKNFFGFGGSADGLTSGFFGTPMFGSAPSDSIAGMTFPTGVGGTDFSQLMFGGGAPEALLLAGAGAGSASGFGDTASILDSSSLFDIGSSGISAGADSFIADVGGVGDYGSSFLDASGEIADVASGVGDTVSGLGDAASGIGDFFGGIPVVGPLSHLAQGDVGGAAGSAVGGAIGTALLPGIGTGIGSVIGGLVGDDSVICTELLRQGKMSKELYDIDIEFSRNLSITILKGYRFWAIPYVKAMRRSKTLTKWAAFFAIRRAESLRGNSIFGSCFRKVFEPACFVIGLFVQEKDHTVLYKTGAI